MAWPAGGPPSFTAGTTATASDANELSDALEALVGGYSEIASLATGDVLYASSASQIGRLAADAGKFLKSGASAPSWATLDPLPLTTAAPATPAGGTLYADTIVKAWVKVSFSGGTPGIDADVNVASLVDNDAGDVTVTFARAMSNANYATAATVVDSSAGPSKGPRVYGQATGSVDILLEDAAGALDRGFSVIVVGAN